MTYKEIRKQIDELNEKSKALVKEEVKDIASSFFKNFPLFDSFAWTQYAPSFNDGDPCYFSAHLDDFEIDGIDMYDEDEESTAGGEASEWLAKKCRHLHEDDLEAAYGDSVKVTVYRNGKVETESYYD